MRRLSFLITLLASALFLLPITLAQGQDQTVQPLPQDQTVQSLPQDQTVQPLPPQEDISQRQEQGQNQSVQPVPIQDVVSVAIADHYFDVADIAIEPGTTVLWINEGKVPHTVTADDGSFDSGELNPGDSYIVTFLGSGRLSYHCQLHSEMVGSVTVGGESRGGEAPPTGPQYSDKPAYEDLEHAIVPTEPRYSNRPTYEDPGHAIVPTGPQYSDKPTYEDPGHAIV
jgi:plastocyanin